MMGSVKRVTYFFLGVIMMLCSFLLFLAPKDGYQIVLLILEITLFLYGVRQLAFYFSMARYMVGGIRIFYLGILILDASLFALYLDDLPRMYSMLYLIGYMLISGAIDVARANEARRQKSGHWKYQMFCGAVKMIVSVVCLFHIDSAEMIAIIYGIGLLHSAATHIVTAFRRTAIVYVQ